MKFLTRSIRLSRGCPGICTWCSQEHGGPRPKDPQQFMDEVRCLDYGLRHGTWELPLGSMSGKRIWMSVYDEDLLVCRPQAKEFLRLWLDEGFHERYRLNLQTNPVSLFERRNLDEELLTMLSAAAPLVQLGAESFNPEVLARWHKRHSAGQLLQVLERFDELSMGYLVNIIYADHRTTAEEFTESLYLLAAQALVRDGMHIDVSPFAGPDTGSEYREELLAIGRISDEQLEKCDFENIFPNEIAEDPLGCRLVRRVSRFTGHMDASEQSKSLYMPQHELFFRAFRLLCHSIDLESEALGAGSSYRHFRLEQLQQQAHLCIERLERLWRSTRKA